MRSPVVAVAVDLASSAEVLEVMREVGIDLAGRRPTLLTEELSRIAVEASIPADHRS
jgi:protein-tyrosine-phosphatase